MLRINPFTHQRITIIAHQHERVDGRCVIGNANAVHRPVLWIVVEDHGGDGVREKVKAMDKRHSNEPSLRVAIRQEAD